MNERPYLHLRSAIFNLLLEKGTRNETIAPSVSYTAGTTYQKFEKS